MKTTNFDRYLDQHLLDPGFAARFDAAGEAWDMALQIAALREKAGLSQQELAHRLKTSQQQVSRLESPAYEGHTLASLRRVAAALGVQVRVVFESAPSNTSARLLASESRARYGSAKSKAARHG